MLARDQVVELLPQYINSYSEDNNFLGDDEILQNIKTGYEALTSDDKSYIQTQLNILHNAAFPREEKVQRAKEYQRDLLIGAVVGAAAGAGAHIYSVYSGGKFFLSKYLAKTALKNTGVGSVFGAFFYPPLKNIAKTQELKRSRPYSRLKEALGLGTILTSARNAAAQLSEGAGDHAGQNLGLHQRRHR